jgi:hypothetical protein
MCHNHVANISLIGFCNTAIELCSDCALTLAHVLLQDLSDLHNGIFVKQENTDAEAYLEPFRWLEKERGKPNFITVEINTKGICQTKRR